MHRKGRSVLALAGYDSANADYMPLARGQIPSQITVVTRTIRVWHQDSDVLTDGFAFKIAKLPFGGTAKELHDAAAVDDYHRIGDSLQNRTEVIFSDSQGFFDLLLIVNIDH